VLDVSLLISCLSLGIEPALMLAIVNQESSGNPIAMNVNAWDGDQVVAESVDDAVEAAGRFVEAGYTVDLGLAGINSWNLERLNVSFVEALDPCTSIALGETIFMEGLDRAHADGKLGDDALRAALSLYNTGSMTRGLANGYVDRVWTRYAASDAYLGRIGSSRVEWLIARDDEPHEDRSSDAAVPLHAASTSSSVPWVSRRTEVALDTVTDGSIETAYNYSLSTPEGSRE